MRGKQLGKKVRSAKETMNAWIRTLQSIHTACSWILRISENWSGIMILLLTEQIIFRQIPDQRCMCTGEKPFSHAGIIRFKGQLMTYVPGEGPCYRCVFKNPPPKDAVPTCKQAGVIGAMGGVIGSLQAMEQSNICWELEIYWQVRCLLLTLWRWNFIKSSFQKILITVQCADDHPTILEPIDYEQEVCEETAGRFDAPRKEE